MENKAHAVIAGLFTLAMLMVAVIAGVYLSRDRIERVPYEFATTMSVQGLNPQAAVRYRGLNVGAVDSLQFDPQVAGRIIVRMNIRKETPMTKGTWASLSYQGVTGIAFVQLNDDGRDPTPLPSSREQVARIELRAGLIDLLQEQGQALLKQTELLARRLNEITGKENEAKITGAVEDIGRAARAFETLPGKLSPTLERLPALADESRRTMAAVQGTAQDLSRNVNQLGATLQAPDGPLQRTARAAEDAAAAAAQAERNIPQVARDLRATLRSVRNAADTVAERPQSLLLGGPAPLPGPGEPGFKAETPAAERARTAP